MHGADRLSALIDVLLDVSRLQTGLLELRHDNVDMSALLARTAESLQATTDLHRLEVRTASEPLCVVGDAGRLEEVLVSLVSNAIKYAPRGGPIALGAQRSGSNVVVSVADRGVGVSDPEQPRIFEPFFRGQNAVIDRHGGLGMGLHISRQIVEWHGGTMWMQSKENEGSTFFFSIPALTVEPADPPRSGTPPRTYVPRCAYMTEASQDIILVVDDDQEILNLLELALTDEGYAVSCARNGREALDILASEIPGLILLDLMMPVMNGWALCQEIKSNDTLREIPVILMSADRRLDRKVQEAQATDHLRKPFDLTALYEIVERYLPRPI